LASITNNNNRTEIDWPPQDQQTIMFAVLDSKAMQVVSAAASINTSPLQSNDVGEQDEALNKLNVSASPGSSSTIIAIDLDDVLCETNKIVSECK